VVTSKLASLKILAAPADDAAVAGSVTRQDELVVTGPARGGYVPVEGERVKGWAKVAQLARR